MSNEVVAVTGAGIDAVVKQALPRLRVEQEWHADIGRLITEGQALATAATIDPTALPAVLEFSDGFLVIARAPEHWHPWKDDLMAGVIDPAVAARLGLFLTRLQLATAERDAELRPRFGSRTAFEQLRVTPFHQQVRIRHPDLAAPIDRTLTAMANTSTCVVHGDYSPKNILVGHSAEELWVIDWEVAHLGDPAWILGHLLLKTIHQPAHATGYHAAATAFLYAWTAARDPAQLIRQTAVLILARIDGRSPVDYLDAAGRDTARTLGRHLLLAPRFDLRRLEAPAMTDPSLRTTRRRRRERPRTHRSRRRARLLHHHLRPVLPRRSRLRHALRLQTRPAVGGQRGRTRRFHRPAPMVFAGSPDDIADRVIDLHELLGHDRQILQMDVGGMPHTELLRSIELLGTEVAPRVHKALD
ncbi:phosphotransferase [Nocardia sp. NPDC005366]|uniref:phosphotransferase family protein n=1 Tax=Nocardia sp. NPDC005366 TaxID=3156878 RepID=UPI0033A5CC81